MCGIAGKIYHDRAKSVDKRLLRRMASAIQHRGPDGEGFLRSNNVGFAIRRLKIIDLNTGNQPIYNEDDSVGIVYNGELYNYVELRDQLIKKGHKFKTASDTEVILHAYEEYGYDCPNYFNGMFSFAINDGRKNSQFFARDRMGIKPFFWYNDKDKFLFASEIKAILCDNEFERKLDHNGVWNYFTFGYIPAPNSIFRGLNKLEPGCSLTLKNGEVSINRYWYPEGDEEFVGRNEEELLEELEFLLFEAVKRRLVSDVPYGAFLSGGIDSSIIVALMSNIMNQPVKTFSIGFTSSAYSELDKARVVSSKYKSEHFEEVINPNAMEVFPDLAVQYDEPFADSSALPTYYLSKMASKHVKMCLSGDGGDELFGGYDRYLPYAEAKDRLPGIFRFGAGLISDLLPFGVRGKNKLRLLSKPLLKRYVETVTTIPDSLKSQFFQSEFFDSTSRNSAFTQIERYFRGTQKRDLLTRITKLDLHTYLVDDILTKVDRASMLNSLEVRIPLLDYKVVEFALKLPSHFKIRNGSLKYLLKKLGMKYFPAEHINSPKMGFGIPIAEWLRSDLKDLGADLLLSSRLAERGIINPDFLLKVWNVHQSKRDDISKMIWTVMMFEQWCRIYIDEK